MSDAAHGQSKPFQITHRSVLAIALPVTIAFISTPLLGLVDTAVVGQFGSAALIGGLAVGSVIISLVFTTFNFLRSGTTGLVAQAVGAEDEKEKQAVLFRALAIAMAAGLVAWLLSPVILHIGLWAMTPTQAVSEATSTYFLIRMISSPFSLGNYVVLGWLLGLGRSGLALIVQLLLNGTNILFSIYLGLVLEWQIEGVAIATVIGEIITFAVGLMICWKLLDRSVTPSRQRIMNGAAWKRLVNLNADIMIRSFALLFAFAYFTAQGAGFGEVTLAANAVLMQLFLIAGYFLDGLATAAEQICGRAIGAKYKEGFWRGFRLTTLWNFIMAFACSAVFLLAGPSIIDLLTTSEDVREVANVYLLWVALIPLSGVLAFQLDGVFIGATWSRDMSIMMLVSLALYILLWQLVKAPMGNHGLWLAIHAFLIFRGVTLGLRVIPNVRKTFA
ncbi:MAG: MATE family efflux transporter [Rhizobiaceae bacterium]|nr:MATE family efflux transporter [Rhizobiaceae bacterium]